MSHVDFTHVFDQIMPAEMPTPLRRVAARATGLRKLEWLYSQLHVQGESESIVSRLLKSLKVEWRAPDADLAHIPPAGPVIVVANHPHGILDGAILLDLIATIRSDVKLLGNSLLKAIPELREVLIDVDPIAGPSAAFHNLRGLREAYEHLASNGLIVIFPAGEVSHLRKDGWSVRDPEWNDFVARLVRMLKRAGRDATTVPIHISGRNGWLFQVAGLLHPRLRTALLGRELLKTQRREIAVRIGHAVTPDQLLAMPDDRSRSEYLRWRTDLLGQCVRCRRSTPHKTPVAARVDGQAMERDIRALGPQARVAAGGDLEVYIAAAADIPNVLTEIGRLRELTFREVGEGTGQSSDLDDFDRHYLHLFLWNPAKREVAGAYRLAATDRVHKLYSATLFNYDRDRLGPAIELGRSFVRAEYQRSFHPLLLLWKGIGGYIARNPRYRTLFGPVSISGDYQPSSLALMIQWLERNAMSESAQGAASGKRPVMAGERIAPAEWIGSLDELSSIVSDLEPNGRGVPVLLRQYLKLGGKLLAFNVDPNFSNAIDGLIVVDLTQVPRRLLDRYFPKGAYAA